MRKTIIISLALAAVLFGAVPAAQAQERAGFGVGVETLITSEFYTDPLPGIATLTYDTGVFQIGGMLMLFSYDDNFTVLGAGGRFYYGIHRGERSDFSVGGGLALVNTDPEPGSSYTDFHLEGGGKIRAFITPNVALTTSLGIGFVIADNDGGDQDVFGLTGNLNASVGISYYFW